MAERVRLYVGTEWGLSVWCEGSRGWEQFGPGIAPEPCRAVVGSPTQPERVFVALEHDGVYATENGGWHWKKIFNHDVWSLALDPADERVMYAGTAPVHLFRSEDSGAHWEELTSLQEMPEEVRARQIYPVPGEQSHILNIFIDPENTDNIVLSLEHGGVIRSRDRGQTWEDVTQGIDYVDIHMVEKPRGRDRYFAATARGFYSTPDLSKGWERAENGFTRDYFYKYIILPPKAGADEQPTMLVSTGDHSPGSWNRPEGARGAIFRSTDCAESWHRVGVGSGFPAEMRERAWMFARHPHDADSVFAPLGRYPYPNIDTGEGTIVLSRDRGDNWERLEDIRVRSAWVLWAAADE